MPMVHTIKLFTGSCTYSNVPDFSMNHQTHDIRQESDCIILYSYTSMVKYINHIRFSHLHKMHISCKSALEFIIPVICRKNLISIPLSARMSKWMSSSKSVMNIITGLVWCIKHCQTTVTTMGMCVLCASGK